MTLLIEQVILIVIIFLSLFFGFWVYFQNKKIPSKINEFKPKLYNIVSILTESNLSLSKSEARSIGIKFNGEKIINEKHVVSPGSVLQKGKIKLLKIK